MRIGKFVVKQSTLKSKKIDTKFYLQVLFRSAVIVSEVVNKLNKTIEYKAICDQFDDVKEGDEVPYYTYQIIRKENKVKFTKVT
jgi:hypothetical protein